MRPWRHACSSSAWRWPGRAAGVWSSHRSTVDGKRSSGRFADASLALLGLLLAFTFSMALSKHDRRRVRVVADSNAIGTFYTTATMLPEPVRTDLQRRVREYVDLRLQIAPMAPSETSFAKLVARSETLQNEMVDLVRRAVADGTPVAAPLVDDSNELLDSHALRLAAFFDRLPSSTSPDGGFSSGRRASCGRRSRGSCSCAGAMHLTSSSSTNAPGRKRSTCRPGGFGRPDDG